MSSPGAQRVNKTQRLQERLLINYNINNYNAVREQKKGHHEAAEMHPEALPCANFWSAAENQPRHPTNAS